MQRPEKWLFFWEEGLNSLPEGEWAVAESQRGTKQDKVKLVYQVATPWKTVIFLKARIELITGGWVSWCWVPKMDVAIEWMEWCLRRIYSRQKWLEDRQGNRKGKYNFTYGSIWLKWYIKMISSRIEISISSLYWVGIHVAMAFLLNVSCLRKKSIFISIIINFTNM